MLTAALCLLLSGCGRAGAAPSLDAVRCDGDTRTGVLLCAPPAPGPGDVGFGIPRANPAVRLETRGARYDRRARVFRFEARLVNRSGSAIGTRDGAEAVGTRVVFHAGPEATSLSALHTGSPAVLDPDGWGTYTAANQPYLLYPGIVAPGEATGWKTWALMVPGVVEQFTFTVRILAPRPGTSSVPPEPPDGFAGPAREAAFAPENIVQASRHMTGPYPRNLIWLWFDVDATREQRQTAVDLVGGVVVGGSRMDRGGIYYLAIEDDGTSDPLFAAIALLRALPYVNLATPDVSMLVGPVTDRSAEANR